MHETGEPAYLDSSDGSRNEVRLSDNHDDSNIKLRSNPKIHETVVHPGMISYASSEADLEAGNLMI